MPNQPSWPSANADRERELVDARGAYDRLVAALLQLQSDLDDAAASLRSRSDAARRLLALHALQDHAAATLLEFAFYDGEAVANPDPRLLEAFYTDPMDCVASRYCWALLNFGGHGHGLHSVIAATELEHRAFTARHQEAPANAPGLADDLASIEAAHRARAERLAYRYAILRRLQLIQRTTAAKASSEAELSQAADAAMHAAGLLRDIRRTRRI